MPESGPATPATSVETGRVFLLCAGLLLAIHLFRNGAYLDHREIWLDEASTYLVAAQPLAEVWHLPTEFHSQPPLYYVLLHFVVGMADSEVALRAPSWLAFAGLLAFVLFGVRELGPFARLAFGIFAVFSGSARYMAQEVRPYALAALASFVASVLLLRLLADSRRRLAAAYAVALVAMLYSLAFNLWVIVAHALFVALDAVVTLRREGVRSAWRRAAPAVVAMGAVSLLYLPYVVYAARWHGSTGHTTLGASLRVMGEVDVYLADIARLLDAPMAVTIPAIVLFCLGLWRAFSRRDAIALFWILCIVTQIALVHGFLQGRSFFSARYLMPAFPAVGYVIALGASRFRDRAWMRWGVLAVLVWAAIASGREFVAYLKAPVPNGTWRSLHARLRELPGREGVFFDVGWEGQPLLYQVRRDPSIEVHADRAAATSFGGTELTPKYVVATVERSASHTRCYLYHHDPTRGRSVYAEAFVPAMRRSGYRWHDANPWATANSPHGRMDRYCRSGPNE